MANREPTLEEYKSFVKDLKTKIKRLQDKNRELVTELVQTKTASHKAYIKVNVDKAMHLTKMTVMVQSVWRGIIARRIFKKKLQRTANGEEPREMDMTNQNVMKKARAAAQKINFTLEELYRAADKKGNGELSLEDFKLFLKRVKLHLYASQMAKYYLV